MTSAQVHDHGAYASQSHLRDYVVGFFLSLLLTFASFGVVMLGVVPAGMGLTSIVLLCVAQLIVQLVYFLHIGAKRSQRQNSAIFLCTAGLIAIIVAGSLWVMHNANTNMMPTHMSIERAKLRD
ncbi:cytochrome [Pandoraea pnomenusa]|uniref:Cytochrome bo(3) ubiquinol oxidase subunit 4 n=1 Tax=Pandoraea pnomenusa TaxID=93220 RepID=A0ABY6WMG2_9BURK|nr:cytochrome o ubiquinol oxidase subunit IV [Pandoraea pnomenusa]VVE67985.1 cytochrome [Pandoraea pnomenusa]